MTAFCSNDAGVPKCKLKGTIVETEQDARSAAQTEKSKSDPCTTYVCGPGATTFQTFPVCAVETDIPVALSDQTCTCVNLNPTPVPLSAKANVAVQAHAVHITPQLSVVAVVESCQAQADVACQPNNGNLGPGQVFVGLRKGMNVNVLPTAYVGPECTARDPRVVTVIDDPKQSLYAVTWIETCLQAGQPWDVLRFSIVQLDPAGDSVSILMSGIPIQILWKPPFKDTSRIVDPDVASLGEKKFGITYSVPDATEGTSLVALVTCELHDQNPQKLQLVCGEDSATQVQFEGTAPSIVPKGSGSFDLLYSEAGDLTIRTYRYDLSQGIYTGQPAVAFLFQGKPLKMDQARGYHHTDSYVMLVARAGSTLKGAYYLKSDENLMVDSMVTDLDSYEGLAEPNIQVIKSDVYVSFLAAVPKEGKTDAFVRRLNTAMVQQGSGPYRLFLDENNVASPVVTLFQTPTGWIATASAVLTDVPSADGKSIAAEAYKGIAYVLNRFITIGEMQ
jgi:hypothetical protein